MVKVAIVYFTSNGHNEQLAVAVAEGVRSVSGAEAVTLQIVGTDIVNGRWKNESIIAELNAADAIVFGTPTYMGGYASQFKAFVDACSSIWYAQGWKNKVGAAFTHSLGLSGDKLNTLNGLVVNAMQHGMIWVGNAELTQSNTTESVNRLTSHVGVMAQSNNDQPNVGPGDRQTAVSLGKRVAEATKRWNGKA